MRSTQRLFKNQPRGSIIGGVAILNDRFVKEYLGKQGRFDRGVVKRAPDFPEAYSAIVLRRLGIEVKYLGGLVWALIRGLGRGLIWFLAECAGGIWAVRFIMLWILVILAIPFFFVVISEVLSGRSLESIWKGSSESAVHRIVPVPTPASSDAYVRDLLARPGSGAPAATPAATFAPRAVRVTGHVPRAKLVNPPADGSLQVGNHYRVKMPTGLEVRAKYLGTLAKVEDLPPENLPFHHNRIGDMFLVGGVPWIWVFAPGATHADWIDP